MIRVILESPYAARGEATVQDHVAYARRAMLDSIRRGEAPMVSHLLYTQVLNDLVHEERVLGIELGQTWRHVADYYVVYTDYGISSGMHYGIALAEKSGKEVQYREIGRNPE